MILSVYRLSERCVDLLKGYDLKNASYNEADVARADALLAWPDSIAKLMKTGMPNLSAIQTPSAGVDDVPYGLIPEEVSIFSNAGAFSESVAEHALALILALAKNVNRKDNSDSYTITGKTFTIIGCGGIGSRVAEMARNAFGCRVIGVSRSFKTPANFDERLGIGQLDHALESADVLVCSLPLNKYTKNLLRYENLSSVKKALIMVNVGRAEVIDEDSVFRLLPENPGVRFATDVFWRTNGKENFESKLWNLPNFMGTLHRAGASANLEVKEKAMERAVTNLRSYLTTGKARNLVKRDDYV